MLLGSAFDHVTDSHRIDIFESLGWSIHLPFGLTKFMLLELVAAGLILAIFIPLAKRAESGDPPKGGFWNAFESLLTFIREQVAKPTIGAHDADHYVPLLWTIFLFVLFCNLLGMIPFLGSPTASFAVTGVMAVVAFVAIHGSAIAKQGFSHYAKAHYPHIEAPFGLGPIIATMIVFIEVFGHFIKAFVLAVRLFANLFAGHLVLAFILTFIVMARHTNWILVGTISIGSVAMVTALSLLELFVAFLQAYIFTYLMALFMGAALHPQH
jgi:F-type H+-transporting ATPase subunit a